jgi:hypothetical protein
MITRALDPAFAMPLVPDRRLRETPGCDHGLKPLAAARVHRRRAVAIIPTVSPSLARVRSVCEYVQIAHSPERTRIRNASARSLVRARDHPWPESSKPQVGDSGATPS